MIKIISYLLSTLLLISCLSYSSCQKQTATTTIENTYPDKKNRLISTPGSSDAGIFNHIVSLYINKHGFASLRNIRNTENVKYLMKNIAEIMKEEEIFENTFNIDENVNYDLNEMIEDGYFYEDGTKKEINDFKITAISKISNREIAAVFNEINSYSGNQVDFITFANNRLDQLQNLNKAEQAQVLGYRQVLEASYTY